MAQITFTAKLIAPHFIEAPPEITNKWASNIKKAAPDAYQGIKKAIKTRKDFQEKIAKPTQKTIASFINPEFVSRSGRTYQNIMDKARESFSVAGKRYIKKTEQAYKNGRYEENVDDGQREYSRKWCRYIGPLKGYRKGGIKGLGALGAMALCGDSRLKDFLKEGIDTSPAFIGTPCAVTAPDKLSNFKRLIDNRIVHWGREIILLDYPPDYIQEADAELNRLVNEYRRSEIIPFSPGGASHIDFIVVEIPDPRPSRCDIGASGRAAKAGQPVRPGHSGGKVKCLGLDISVAVSF